MNSNLLPLGKGNVERTAEVQRLQENGCSVLILNCPEGVLFGIDYAAWSVGPQFMGIKLIPPGLHYVYCSASAAEDVGISRTGFFLYMRPQEVAVFRWNAETEELVKPESQDEEARYADGVRSFDFDRNLGPYPLELAANWSELTRHATADVVNKIEPVAKVVRSKRAEYDPAILPETKVQDPTPQTIQLDGMDGDDDEVMGDVDAMEEPAAEQPQTPLPAQDPSSLESNMGSGCLFFSAVPRSRKKVGTTPLETTQLHMDGSSKLEAMIAKEYGGNEFGILGELQLAYIAFLLGQNYDGFEQWRSLLLLLCSCESAAVHHSELFSELCRTFFAQLSQAPSDLFGDDLTRDNFMGTCAISLLEICDTQASSQKLRKRCMKLRELVEEKFGLSTQDLALLGEDAPQIVDYEDGRDLVNLAGVGGGVGEMD
mmetsp:Transcript_66814/g.118298  ORF Transcript_66814/g.118298 Transcript_66814/m.118298 type:complete len:429 (+) Transcript_66814:48-1334(+)|eukprot:CAMPEP_0197624498 /NCGR_PEP_ID=MMETSP1338-20131121/4104_1 /TAXON_ID=43686 ORGANISM="Pelagodinium beii, Strain RCC1491" /NCGR_SAMPLE_ID=MMETSP1338 /ASSEMBLY_ACC=CAM_ASM_000754 /LENGTH=428 /DNA_ID=CAMNT_0043194637 /DNA_START=48 /DNA_END=1334 /DNA_ORIENTATION=+